MDDVPEARSIPDATLAAMIRAVEPGWELREAEPTQRGFCSVYRVAVVDGGSTRELYLKASPDGQPWSLPTEARLQTLLAETTAIPVADVCGVVDDHGTLPTPYYVMDARPGTDLAYEHVGRLGDDTLERLARETGESLADLHSVPAVDGFGHVRHDGPELTGERPSGDPATLTVGDPRKDWHTYLDEYADAELERHADSRFSGLTRDLRQWIRTGIDELEEPFEPVLARNDHGLHNLLVDPDTGEITAILDWGYTLAVPPRFDFEFAVSLYSGTFLAGLSDVEDRRSLVREAMVCGYRERAPDRADVVSTPRPLYELLAMVRIMNDFHRLELPEGTDAAIADRIRSDVQALIGTDPL